MGERLVSEVAQVAQRVRALNWAMANLIKDKEDVEAQQHKTYITTTSVLAMLSSLAKEQIRFCEDFAILCRAWRPSDHQNDVVPQSMIRRLIQWCHDLQYGVQQLSTRATSLQASAATYRDAAQKLASEVQRLFQDEVRAIGNEITRLQLSCEQERAKLTNEAKDIVSTRDKLCRKRDEINKTAEALKDRTKNRKSAKIGLGLSLGGTALGVASFGLLVVCPPLGAATAVASVAGGLGGLGFSTASIVKSNSIQEGSHDLSRQVRQITSDMAAFEQKVERFKKEAESINLVHVNVKFLMDQFGFLQASSEALERTSLECYIISSSMNGVVCGMRSSSSALKMAATGEQLIDCVEAVLSDVANSLVGESTLRSLQWYISAPDLAARSLGRDTDVPITLEQLALSPDSRTLIGIVAVKNIAVNKSVVARFTWDDWWTNLDVEARYRQDLAWKGQHDGRDRFSFEIDLTAWRDELDECTVLLCIRYNVGGREYWDNNGGSNFKIMFKTDHKALYAVLDELSSRLDKLKVCENNKHDLQIIEDRDDYEELMDRGSTI